MVVLNRRGMGEELMFLLFFAFGFTLMLFMMYFIWTAFSSVWESLGVPSAVATIGATTIVRFGRFFVFAFFSLGMLSIVLTSRLNASPAYYVVSVFMIILALFFVPVAQLGIELVTNNTNMSIPGLNDSAIHFPIVMAMWDNMGIILLLLAVLGIAVTYGRSKLFRVEGT